MAITVKDKIFNLETKNTLYQMKVGSLRSTQSSLVWRKNRLLYGLSSRLSGRRIFRKYL